MTKNMEFISLKNLQYHSQISSTPNVLVNGVWISMCSKEMDSFSDILDIRPDDFESDVTKYLMSAEQSA